MDKTKINGVDLEYEVRGSGEPLLLISTGPIADSFQPFLGDRALTERHRLVAYHQRGQGASARGPGSEGVSFAQHAADAAALLDRLRVPRAHVAGHSTGAVIALQLALDRPDLVHTLVLLEPPLSAAPSAGAFIDKAGPALAAYRSGDREGGMAQFLSLVSGLDWQTCRGAIDKQVPGGVAQAMKDVDAFFGSYLPAIGQWEFGPKQAATIAQPTLSVLGTGTDPWFRDSHELLRTWMPQVEDCPIGGVGHFLHLQRPEGVLSGVATWLARHPIAGKPAIVLGTC